MRTRSPAASSVELKVWRQRQKGSNGRLPIHKILRRFQQLGLHEIRNGRLSLLNPKARQRIAAYDDLPPKDVPVR